MLEQIKALGAIDMEWIYFAYKKHEFWGLGVKYYGLNVCVPLILIPKVMVLRSGASGS